MYSIDRILGSKELHDSIDNHVRWKSPVYNYDDTLDVISRVNLRVWRHGDFRSRGEASAWLIRAINSAYIDMVRANHSPKIIGDVSYSHPVTEVAFTCRNGYVGYRGSPEYMDENEHYSTPFGYDQMSGVEDRMDIERVLQMAIDHFPAGTTKRFAMESLESVRQGGGLVTSSSTSREKMASIRLRRFLQKHLPNAGY